MKSRRQVIFFRVLLILTFFAGMIYLISFVSLAGAPARMSTEDFLSACHSWTYIFFFYMALCIASAVFSVLELRVSDRKHLAVLRTVVIVFAALSDILAIRYIAVFRGYEDAVEAAKAVDSLVDTGTVFIIMSFAGAMLLFFIMVSSVYHIVRLRRIDEFDAVVEPEKPKQKPKAQ
ncbi:MAG: hypothetical protein IKN17_00320 [Ruminococcus sp.]|nr:hypothetical protein [Ruminococcus sp.]